MFSQKEIEGHPPFSWAPYLLCYHSFAVGKTTATSNPVASLSTQIRAVGR